MDIRIECHGSLSLLILFAAFSVAAEEGSLHLKLCILFARRRATSEITKDIHVQSRALKRLPVLLFDSQPGSNLNVNTQQPLSLW